jgi:hypothetical protein
MRPTIFAKYAVPFLFWYTLMILSTIALDYVLHYFHLPKAGLYAGYAGTFLLVISFVYSLRKRKIIENGSPKKLLRLHEYLAWAGSVLILVHAGIHYNAHLPWLAVGMLLINVASGLVGKFLLKDANESLATSKQHLQNAGLSAAEVDKQLFFDAITVKAMGKWRSIHLPIALLFGIFALLHIITIMIFGQ